MEELQLLALRHIVTLAEELDNEAIDLGNTIELDKVEFNSKKHTYPIAGKSRRIAEWAEAIIESNK